MGKWESITLIALFVCISFAMRGCAQMQVDIAKAKYQTVESSKEIR